jgi:hypothetical protein
VLAKKASLDKKFAKHENLDLSLSKALGDETKNLISIKDQLQTPQSSKDEPPAEVRSNG